VISEGNEKIYPYDELVTIGIDFCPAGLKITKSNKVTDIQNFAKTNVSRIHSQRKKGTLYEVNFGLKVTHVLKAL